jgi:hypothetical protein
VPATGVTGVALHRGEKAGWTTTFVALQGCSYTLVKWDAVWRICEEQYGVMLQGGACTASVRLQGGGLTE